MEDAEYVIVGQGSMPLQANAVADYLREKRGIKMGVVNLTMFRPFPGDLLGKLHSKAVRASVCWSVPTSRWLKICQSSVNCVLF